jgi:DNA modification methylase
MQEVPPVSHGLAFLIGSGRGGSCRTSVPKYKGVIQVRAVARTMRAGDFMQQVDVAKSDPDHSALPADPPSSVEQGVANGANLGKARRQPSNQQTLHLDPPRRQATAVPRDIQAIYDTPIPSSRTGALFNAHSYPTKINPTAAMACVLAHTDPGDVVFDGFAGSGATGIAAALCGMPDPGSRATLETRIPGVQWGARNAVLYDLSELACFISNSLLNSPDPIEFESSAKSLLNELRSELSWMYAAKDPEGAPGEARHLLWTENLLCPACGEATTFWEAAVELEPARIKELAQCPKCGEQFKAGSADRVTEVYWDDLLRAEREKRLRSACFVYGISGRRRWKREIQEQDLDVLHRVGEHELPSSIPVVRMMRSADERWGYMHRRGYHFGVEYVHDFYTRRNLVAVGKAWELIAGYPEHLQDALRFWVSSYNASHSTLMTRVVCKKSSEDFVLSGAQPAALYIGGLPVEKNVIAGLQRKLPTISSAFAQLYESTSSISVQCGSSLSTSLPDASVDYIFTDPPFGDNIQYSEVNFISEAWLGRFTDADEEAVVSPTQGKSVTEYGQLLKGAFVEAYRVLKPGKFMTVAFHSTQPDVWEALRNGWEVAGFEVVTTSILDKEQTSFKQTTTQGAAQKDPLILLRKSSAGTPAEPVSSPTALDYWAVIDSRVSSQEIPRSLKTKRHLFSYLVTVCLERGAPIPFTASDFYAELGRRYPSLHEPEE